MITATTSLKMLAARKPVAYPTTISRDLCIVIPSDQHKDPFPDANRHYRAQWIYRTWELASLAEFLEKEPLLLAAPSLKTINPELFKRAFQKSIVYGTGLCTRDSLSEGIPFDFVGFFCSAELLRRKLHMKKAIHIIGDSHAKSNEALDPKQIDERADAFKRMMEHVRETLKLDGRYEVLKASEFEKNPSFERIYASSSLEGLPEYERLQLADIEYFRKEENAALKLSWLTEPKKPPRFDERYFDALYRERLGDNLSFIYTKPGKNPDNQRSNAVPYLAANHPNRILLSDTAETVQTKIKNYRELAQRNIKAADSTLKHLQAIVQGYESAFGAIKLPTSDKDEYTVLAKKISYIIHVFTPPE